MVEFDDHMCQFIKDGKHIKAENIKKNIRDDYVFHVEFIMSLSKALLDDSCKHKEKLQRVQEKFYTKMDKYTSIYKPISTIKENDICSICLEKNTTQTSVELNQCKHRFHTKCLRKCFRNKIICCPNCRVRFKSTKKK